MKLHLEITGRCNLACVHCYNKKYNNKKSIGQELSHEEWLRIIRAANVLHCERFTISGGEPLLYADGQFKLLIELIKECKAKVILLTNGHLLTVAKLKELESSDNLFAIRLSLDGLKSHNKFRIGSDYKEIIRQIKIIHENSKLQLGIVTMLNKNNLNELVDLYNELKLLGINRWNIDVPFYTGNYKENLNDFGQATFGEIVNEIKHLIGVYISDGKPFQLDIANIYKSKIAIVPYDEFDFNSHPCSYSDIICIKPNGNITVCAAYDLILSSVKKIGSLNLAIKQARSHQFYLMKVGDIKKCKRCRYIILCGGGCRADAKYLTGSGIFPDPICCSLLPLVEKEILPVLPKQEKRSIFNLLNIRGTFPYAFENIEDILKRYKKTNLYIKNRS